MILQCNPSIPVEVIGKGTGETLFLIDYGAEWNLLWVVGLDSTGEIWTVPNSDIRLIKNYSLGRNLEDKKSIEIAENEGMP